MLAGDVRSGEYDATLLAAARAGCVARELDGPLTLVHRGRDAFTYRLDDRTHGPLAVRADSERTPALRTLGLEASCRLQTAGVPTIPPFDARSTEHESNAGVITVTLHRWVSISSQPLDGRDASEQGRMLRQAHDVPPKGLPISLAHLNDYRRRRWDRAVNLAQGVPGHPLRDAALVRALDVRLREATDQIESYVGAVEKIEGRAFLHQDWGNNVVPVDLQNGRRQLLFFDWQFACAGARFTDFRSAVSKVVKGHWSAADFRTFMIAYGENAPAVQTLAPFGGLVTFDTLTSMNEALVRGEVKTTPFGNFPEVVDIALRKPNGPEQWIQACHNLADPECSPRWEIPDFERTRGSNTSPRYGISH